MAKRSAAMQSHHTLNMPAPRLRRGLGMPPLKPRVTEHYCHEHRRGIPQGKHSGNYNAHSAPKHVAYP